jgi:hypothetical protein
MSMTTHPKSEGAPLRGGGRPLSRRMQAGVMRAVNVPMRRLLALPVATPLSDRLMLLYLRGRKTGRAYRQPVSYVRDGEVLLTPGGGNWKLNLVAGRAERIRLRGHDVLARPEIISDINEIERLLAIIIAANPTAGRFVGAGKGPDGRVDRARLETAVRYGFRVIRWHVEEPAETRS